MLEIIIKNLSLFGYHGVNSEEKIRGQEFLFNISILLSEAKIKKEDILRKDDIRYTVDYSSIIKIVRDINDNNKFELLETLSGIIAENILSFSPLIKRVRVRVEKTKPPINEEIGSVGVEAQFEMEKKVKVFLSLGSNLGDRERNLRDAVDKIHQDSRFDVTGVSSIYETEPMYLKEQDSFYNIVMDADVDDTFDPFELLGYLKGIEYSMGRAGNDIRYGPRIIDLDILCFDNIEIVSDFLVIPHPGILERGFVLIPFNEIAPDFMIKGRKIKDIVSNMRLAEKVKKVKSW